MELFEENSIKYSIILNNIMELCPLDTRYKNKTEKLRPFFSNYAYTKYRAFVEFTYFYSLLRFLHKNTDEDEDMQQLFEKLTDEKEIYNYCLNNHKFTIDDYNKIIEIEKTTNHDVKAIEYFVKQSIVENNKMLEKYIELVHFGLTSQDINNVALSIMIKEANMNIMLPGISQTIFHIRECGKKWKSVLMLAKTHGQPAVPTTLGKEFLVFYERLHAEYENLLQCQAKLSTKMGGAVGNLNAHYAAYPSLDWEGFFINYLEMFNLKRQYYTTQIEHYDGLSCLFDTYRRINNILKDLCQDVWLYISMDYLSQKVVQTETGSSTMPHKVNPILFENAEGNIAIANALFELFSNKLPVSRLQRDLTDSTVVRNIGMSFGYMSVALQSIKGGLKKIEPNMGELHSKLQENHFVIVEGIQTILRKHNVKNPYEMMKELTRGKMPTDFELREFVRNMNISDEIKDEILKLSISKYTGNSVSHFF